jgi:hypothetical protein
MEDFNQQCSPKVQSIDRSLRDTFLPIFRLITTDKLCDLSSQTEKLLVLLHDIDFCIERVQIEGHLSKNEELDDIQTPSLPVRQH